jgi:aldehyde dehydrogenase (NAD+)
LIQRVVETELDDQLVDQHFDELAALDTIDMGVPISRTSGNRLRAVGMLR